MKRTMPWSEDDSSSSGESSSDSETKDGSSENKKKTVIAKDKTSQGDAGKKKVLGFDALRKHGYKGGPSVLRVPLPREEHTQDWSWSDGKERRLPKESEESFEERQKTRAAILEGEELRHAQTQREKKASFAQKEKRKRDLGQASRGKNYVEEEKRLLRENGVYSGFDA